MKTLAIGLKDKSGVALIMVLGLLSLMLIMALAFSNVTRVERKAASNEVRAVEVNLLFDAAVWRAVSNVEEEHFTLSQAYPDRSSVFPVGGPASLLISSGSDAYGTSITHYVAEKLIPSGNPPSSFKNIASNSFPEVYRPSLAQAVRDMQWLPVGGGSISGRYAYVAANVSGLPDANHIGDPARPSDARNLGASPFEILYEDVAGVVFESDASQSSLATNLDARVRIEDVWEFDEFARDDLTGLADHMFVYTRNPRGALLPGEDAVSVVVDVGGDSSAIQGRATNIIAAFTAMGLTAVQAGYAYTNLLDYADADRIPQSLEAPSVERVPMVNEIALRASLDAGATNITALSLDVELFYPFPEEQTEAVDFVIAYTLEWATNSVWTAVTNATWTNSTSINGLDGDSATPANIFPVMTVINAKDFPIGASGAPTVNLRLSGVSVQVQDISIPTDILDLSTSAVSTAILPLALTPSGGEQSASIECIDPRFNWDLNDTDQWTPQTANTLANMNAAVAAYASSVSSDVALKVDQGYFMHVQDEPLRVVGELGYICIAPWRTLRLFKDGSRTADFVYDYFSVGTDVQYGLINPNTEFRDVLTAVFNDMPLLTHPDQGPSGLVLSVADAEILADEIYGLTLPNPLTSLSTLQEDETFHNALSSLWVTSPVDDCEKESVMRNSAGLFGLRNNVFNMVLICQSGIDLNGNDEIDDDEVTATKKANVVVWRDGLPKASGVPHPRFVRRIRVIDE